MAGYALAKTLNKICKIPYKANLPEVTCYYIYSMIPEKPSDNLFIFHIFDKFCVIDAAQIMSQPDI